VSSSSRASSRIVGSLVAAGCVSVVALSIYAPYLLSFEAGRHPASFASRNIYVYVALVSLAYACILLVTVLAGVGALVLWHRVRVVTKSGLIFVCGLGVCGMIALAQQPPGYVGFVDGLSEFTRREVDVVAIREWMLRDSGRLRGCIASEDWPDAISQLSPAVVQIDRNMDGHMLVRISWGGGFGHYGVTLALPGTDLADSSSDLHVRHVDQGVWVWHEIQ